MTLGRQALSLLAAGRGLHGRSLARVLRVLRVVTALKGGPVVAQGGSMAERTRYTRNPWVVFGLLVEVGTLVGYFRLAGTLVLPGVAILCGIALVIGAARWSLRGSWAGFLLLGVAVGVPDSCFGIPITWHGSFARARFQPHYLQSSPLTLRGARITRCCTAGDRFTISCRTDFARSVRRWRFTGAGDEPLAVLFHLLPGRHAVVALRTYVAAGRA